jgi:glutamine amidotransferase-like uncharacterized protein
MRRTVVAVAIVVGVVSAASADARGRVDAGIGDYQNLERNLRWMLVREREPERRPLPRVGVYVDMGVWHPSARGAVEALEADGVPCRLVDRPLLVSALTSLDALVVPGGWGPLEAQTIGDDGAAAIRSFVARGGRCVGLGTYVFARVVAWEGKTEGYGFGLFDGAADGPLATVAPWPRRAPVRLAITEAGRRRGLEPLGAHDVLYYGSPRFLGGKPGEVLATYPDGTAAIVARAVGNGEVVMIGPSIERPVPERGGDESPAAEGAGGWLRALLRIPR